MKKKLSWYKKKLWRLTSEYVRKRDARERLGDVRGMGSNRNSDNGQCVTCGIIKPIKELQAGHFIPRAQGNATYFDLRNVHTQCYRCNINLGGNGAEYYPYMLDRYGQETIDELRRLSNTTVKFTRSDYEDMIEDMQEKLKGLDE